MFSKSIKQQFNRYISFNKGYLGNNPIIIYHNNQSENLLLANLIKLKINEPINPNKGNTTKLNDI
jgi:hypothetical protein